MRIVFIECFDDLSDSSGAAVVKVGRCAPCFNEAGNDKGFAFVDAGSKTKIV